MRLRPSEEFHHDHGLVIAGYYWLLLVIEGYYHVFYLFMSFMGKNTTITTFNGVKSGLVKCAERIHVDLLLHTLPLV